MANRYFWLDEFVRELVGVLTKQRMWDVELNNTCLYYEVFNGDLYTAALNELAQATTNNKVTLQKEQVTSFLKRVGKFLQEKVVLLRVENETFCNFNKPDLMNSTTIILSVGAHIDDCEEANSIFNLSTPSNFNLATPSQHDSSPFSWEFASQLLSSEKDSLPFLEAFDDPQCQTSLKLGDCKSPEKSVIHEQHAKNDTDALHNDKSIQSTDDQINKTVVGESFSPAKKKTKLSSVKNDGRKLHSDFEEMFGLKKNNKKRKKHFSKQEKDHLLEFLEEKLPQTEREELLKLVDLNLKTLECFRLLTLKVRDLLSDSLAMFK